MNRFPELFRVGVVRLAAAALSGAMAMSAQANIGVTPHDAFANVGSDAAVKFAFDLGTLTEIGAFDLTVGFDPAVLSFIGVAADYHGTAIDPVATLSGLGTFSSDTSSTPGLLTATYFNVDANFNMLPPLSLSGVGSITFKFHVDAAPVPGPGTLVSFDLNLADAGANPLPSVNTSAQVITTVPEPESWVLALAGLPLVLALAGRRRAGCLPA